MSKFANIKMESVDSSNISSVGYDATKKELHIIFKSTPRFRYVYKQVPSSVYKRLMDADSKGQYHASHVKDDYLFDKVPNQ